MEPSPLPLAYDPRTDPRITVDEATGCWHGRGSKIKGHTRLPLAGQQTFGHVIMFVVFRGTIPRGSVLHHRCETPDCWNPWHVEPLSTLQHKAEHSATRSACPNGHAYPANQFRDTSGKLRCRICTADYKREAKRRARANRHWRCVGCQAEGDGEQFPLVAATTRRCVTCGAQGGHKVKPIPRPLEAASVA